MQQGRDALFFCADFALMPGTDFIREICGCTDNHAKIRGRRRSV